MIGNWPLVPTVGAASNITLTTYNGTAFVGISADQSSVADIENFIDDLRSGFNAVLGGSADDPVTSLPGEMAAKAKKRSAKKTSAKKSTAKKKTSKKTSAKKSPAKKSSAKKSSAKKTSAKKAGKSK